MVEVLAFANHRQFRKIVVDGDSKIVIDAVARKCAVPCKIRTIVEDIICLALSFELIEWNHAYREANFTTNAITSLGHNYTNLYVSEGVFLPKQKMLSCMILEALGVT